MIKKIRSGYEIDGQVFHADTVICDRELVEKAKMVEGSLRVYCLQKNIFCCISTFKKHLKSGQRCWLEEVTPK